MYATALGLAFGVLSGLTVLIVGSPAAWADGCTSPANGPTGADAAAFTYQCDGTEVGDWTSPYYVYNPTTAVESPLYSETYQYDCTNNVWQQNEWDYNATSGAYVENWVPATVTPDQPTGCPAPAATPASNTSATSSTDNTDTAVNNNVGSASQSGNAVVAHNGQAGDATSGSSTAEVTVGNVVGTTGNALNGSVATFTTTLGDVNGNFVLDPSAILPAGTTAAAQPPAALSSTNSDTSISNAITATAASGNAIVAGNGDAGNAASGNADAIVNLINIINSAVASGQSFIGTINITGNMNGDILIPQSVIDQLLASNGAGSDNPNATNVTNQSIINNINASAQSGNATVAHNGQAGDATTGQSGTNVTVLNLTGSSVVGKNVLLVFVNVLGKWVGMIMNAPAGTTSAEFGGSVSSSAPSTDSSEAGGNTVEANSTAESIVNNVTASAQSGNATVVHNRDAGNAQSGNAYTAVNILNVENSELSLANWFGILFINVFGTWNGNFGIQPTPAPAVPESSNSSQTDGIATAAFAAVNAKPRHLATFVPTTGDTSGGTTDSAILGDATTTPVNVHNPEPSAKQNSVANYLIAGSGVVLATLLLLAAERDKLFRRDSN